MQFNPILNFIYENFLFILITLIILVVFFSGSLIYEWSKKIKTIVLYFKKNTAEWIIAKEEDNALTFDGKIALRYSDPYVIQKGRRVFRLFLVPEGLRLTADFRKLIGMDKKVIADYVTIDLGRLQLELLKDEELKDELLEVKSKLDIIIEEKVIEQGVKGFMAGVKTSLISILGYIAIGFMLAVIVMEFM